jgi:hypothetical protein
MGDGMKKAAASAKATQRKPKLTAVMRKSLQHAAAERGENFGVWVPYTTAHALIVRGLAELVPGTLRSYRITPAGLEALK